VIVGNRPLEQVEFDEARHLAEIGLAGGTDGSNACSAPSFTWKRFIAINIEVLLFFP
jgi:hypothetical protein